MQPGEAFDRATHAEVLAAGNSDGIARTYGRSIGGRVFMIAPWLGLVLLAGANVALLRQNLQMRSELKRVKPDALKPGDHVPPFAATSLDYNRATIAYTGKETMRVFLFFTPTCPYCSEQFDYWRPLLNSINGNRFQVLGIVSASENRTALAEYLDTSDCDSLPMALVGIEVLRAYKLSITPTTLVVDNNGIVQKVWTGKWTEKEIEEVGAFFHVRFPE